MKKFESIVLCTIAFFASTTVLITGCQKSDRNVKQNMFYDQKTKATFNLEDQNQLAQLVKIAANEQQEIQILGDEN
ncbi:MAG: hypothetical protein C4330_13155 [Chitinophagaceae bacterium]